MWWTTVNRDASHKPSENSFEINQGLRGSGLTGQGVNAVPQAQAQVNY